MAPFRNQGVNVPAFILTIIFTIIIALIGFGVRSIDQRLGRIETKQDRMEIKFDNHIMQTK